MSFDLPRCLEDLSTSGGTARPLLIVTCVVCKLGSNVELISGMEGKRMRRFTIAATALLSIGTLAGCASQPPAAPPTTANLGATEGTVTFTGGAVAIGIGFQWGSGSLTYQGRQ